MSYRNIPVAISDDELKPIDDLADELRVPRSHVMLALMLQSMSATVASREELRQYMPIRRRGRKPKSAV